MTEKEAIKIIKMERDHCATHNQDAGMSIVLAVTQIKARLCRMLKMDGGTMNEID